MTFTPISAAFEGFRLIVRRPVSFLVWCLFLGLIFGVVAVFMTVQGAAISVGRFNPAGSVAAQLLMLADYVVGFSVLSCAVYRAVLTPGERRYAYLRLGADEFKLMAVMGALVLILIVMSFFVGMVMMVIVGMLGQWVGTGLVVVFYLGVSALSVRLSLIGPICVMEGRDVVLASIGLTAKRFWSLLGMWAIVSFVNGLILIGVVALSGVLLTPLERTWPAAGVLYLPLVIAVVTLLCVLSAAAAAGAYQGLMRRPEAPVEVFD